MIFDWFRKKEEREDAPAPALRQEEFHDIEAVVRFIYSESGITFENQTSVLQNKMVNFCRKRGIFSFKELLQNVETDSGLKQEVINYLTTNETYFYRETAQIVQLVTLVKQAQGDVRILCAPSATGEEPYSIAIALLEAGVPAGSFSIVGIDINSEAIKKAEAAVYGERNIRNLPMPLQERYFTREGPHYRLIESLKRSVSFHVVNIFDDAFKQLGRFDFVLSRNMLIYFDKETKRKAKQILEGMRKDDSTDVFFGHADLF